MDLRFVLMLSVSGILVAGCSTTTNDIEHVNRGSEQILVETLPDMVPDYGFEPVAGYDAINDNGFAIPPVNPKYLNEQTKKTIVNYNGDEAPGTIVVDPHARRLYLVQEGGKALRYGIAVGREGLGFKGEAVIGKKAEWPKWRPTQNMLETQPEMYAQYAEGLPGGLNNPLGARALYLYQDNKDTMFRIHGTIDNSSIGRATSAGCIRMFNQDVIDLFEQVPMGAFVKVRTMEESVALEGFYMDDAYGRIVPVTQETLAQKEIETKALEEQKIKEMQEQLQNMQRFPRGGR